MTWFEVLHIFQWLVIHELSHIWNDFTHVWICSKHLWFISQVHSSFIFLHLLVFPVAHSFPSLALYPHGVTEIFFFVVQYDNVSDISKF